MDPEQITEGQIEDIFEDDIEETTKIVEDVIKDDKKVVEEKPQLSPLEIEAAETGWTSKVDFVAKGGDPERHKSAHEYVEYGKLYKAMNNTKASQDRMESSFNKQIEGLNKLHQAQADAQLKSFKGEQRDAVEDRDVEAYDAAQVKIDDLEKAKPKVEDVQTRDPLIIEWENKNAWCKDKDDPRAAEAVDLWNSYANRNPDDSITNALAYVDRAMGLNQKPKEDEREVNPRRETPSETTRQTTSTKVKSGLAFNDLTREEQDFYNQTKFDLWADEKHPEGNIKDYLKAVKNSRKGQ